jgi:hypothetical protein
MKKYILIILLLATILSCTKTLDFDEGNNETQLVLNSIIWPDSAFSASITKSTSILKGHQISQATDGSLDFYENGTLMAQITSPTGQFYAPDIKPRAGKSYRIVVSSNGKQVEAETTIPNQAEVISVDTSSVVDEYGSRRVNYNVRIKDPVGDDFYRIFITSEILTSLYQKSIWKYFLSKRMQSITTTDPVFNSLYNNIGSNAIDIGPYNHYSIFPDDYFKGKDYSVQFQNGFWYSSYQGYGYKYIYDRTTIHVQRLSKDLYNYLKYLTLHNHYRDNPFSEPVPVYSNVKNGTGIFAGFNDNVVSHFEKVYIPFSMDTIKVEEQYGGYNYGGGY